MLFLFKLLVILILNIQHKKLIINTTNLFMALNI